MFNKLKLWYKNRKIKREEKLRDYWSSHDIDFELKRSQLHLNSDKSQFFTCLGACIFLLTIFLVLLICTIGAYVSVITPEKDNVAHADYIEDVQNNPNSLVTFNQLILNDYVSSHTYSTSGINDVMYAVMKTGHVYYIKFDFDSFVDNTIAYRDSLSHWVGICTLDELTNTHYSNIFTCSVDNSYLYVYVRTNSSVISNFCLIDLTLMFGDNIPSLSQADDLFVANYYYYNSGSVISFNGLESYGQGYNDALGSYQWYITNGSFLSSTQSVNLNGYQGTVSSSNSALSVSSVSDSTYTTCYIPFNFRVAAGSLIRFAGRSTISSTDHNTRYLKFAYYSNGQMIDISSHSTTAGSYNPMDFQFNAPTDLDGVYLYLNDSELSFTIYLAEFYVMIPNVYAAIQSSYDSGWDNAKTYYESYYGVGGTGYNYIKNLGFNEGINTENPYTFGALMSSVIEAPLNAVLNLFNFEFLGVNLKNVVTVLFTLAVLVAILGLFLGGK